MKNNDWAETIARAAEEAEKLAKLTADDHIAHWSEDSESPDPAVRQDAAERAADALAHAGAWIGTAQELREAAEKAKNGYRADAATAVREAIEKAGRNADQADWGSLVADELREAAKQALQEAGEDEDDRRLAGAAADLAAAYAETVTWG